MLGRYGPYAGLLRSKSLRKGDPSDVEGPLGSFAAGPKGPSTAQSGTKVP